MQSASLASANFTDPHAAFDATFTRRAPAFTSRPEAAADQDFLIRLFCACSPLAPHLPPVLLESQARLQIASHNHNNPLAMRRIIDGSDGPIGRIMVDWTGESWVHGIDIAVLPDRRRGAPGAMMMRAWLDVADAIGRPAKIEVVADNPVRRFYERLGFRAVSDGPVVDMVRDSVERCPEPHATR